MFSGDKPHSLCNVGGALLTEISKEMALFSNFDSSVVLAFLSIEALKQTNTTAPLSTS
jgi:hypothetical protein